MPPSDALTIPDGERVRLNLRQMLAFAGPGFLVAVGYLDPGNWATGIAAGSAHGYSLLWVILAANLLALMVQYLAAKLGIISGLDLAQACAERYGAAVRAGLWLTCEAAIIACDLAEVLGAAIALNLLFGLPLWLGACLTGLEVLLILSLQRRGMRTLEAGIVALIATIGLCFAVELVVSRPSLPAIFQGLMPNPETVTNPAQLYLAIGILGATVMPHNLYLHSALVKAPRGQTVSADRRLKLAFADVAIALTFALFINAAILILAASAFHARGMTGVAGLGEAYQLLSPTLGVGFASTLFAVALLASGQNSSITATMAGQVVMEGFTRLRMTPWKRRLLSRALAIIPAALVGALMGAKGVDSLLILSQVVLSLQLPFAVVPLVRMTDSPGLMGPHANGPLLKMAAWSATVLIIGLNVSLLARLALGDAA